jgi:protein-S-isoprenylcysteine O-methyltransferase Ste14
MTDLNRSALIGLSRTLIILTASLFLSAWTLHYWQAWTFLAVFSACAIGIAAYLMKNDPTLLARRVKAGPGGEQEKTQRVIYFFLAGAVITAFIFPALDHRFAWSRVPRYVVVFGDALVALGFLIIFFVFKENTYTSPAIELDAGQKVISTGPYALVRHPMYAGILLMFLGVPLALGSAWGLFTFIPMVCAILWRLLDEEKFLSRNLPGYSEYRNSVRYRLMPFVW